MLCLPFSIFSPWGLRTPRSTCPCLASAGMKDMHHQALTKGFFLNFVSCPEARIPGGRRRVTHRASRMSSRWKRYTPFGSIGERGGREPACARRSPASWRLRLAVAQRRKRKWRGGRGGPGSAASPLAAAVLSPRAIGLAPSCVSLRFRPQTGSLAPAGSCREGSRSRLAERAAPRLAERGPEQGGGADDGRRQVREIRASGARERGGHGGRKAGVGADDRAWALWGAAAVRALP